MTPNDSVLEACSISKSFPGVKALDAVDLTLRSGRLTALLGENGAGKSTLMKILAGVQPPDDGALKLHGESISLANPKDALDHGIAMIHQELCLVPHLSVAENLFLGREPVRFDTLIHYRDMNQRAAILLERLELNISPTTPVGKLRVGQQQLVEIARAFAGDVRVLIMDEPTSAITEHETQVLFRCIADLKKQNVAIVYITHRLEELSYIADDVAVMRDGRMIGTADHGVHSQDELVRMMAGRDVQTSVRSASVMDQEALRVENIRLPHPTRPADKVVDQVSFHVRRGEVFGIFGLMGAGRTELLECIFGLHHGSSEGRVVVGGNEVTMRSPQHAIRSGLALVPEDRKQDGLVLSMTVQENASLASLDRVSRWGWLNASGEENHVRRFIDRFRVKTPSLREKILNLSGGNQQKVILAKWLATDPTVLMLDEPTRGIDVQAKNEIYELINELTAEGLAVVMVSSELPEVMAVSDRVLVLSEGRATAEFERQSVTDEDVLHAALPRRAAS
ncbi:sugar ABC transporter ATP-binding protein [Rhodopirellula halodulae]|uniref:sugar ABC transporter ATP-binding protein n=1 Tax=Rhodopirellula halodulae TaxID=2894198 RepID=UPI001E283574|nr:sugar ABC transporter ATP-binding protein [Rhodopirellula sp. JC737]MCC9654293.1 sugar ABC transporter ATP-binding protein [Rhodopirellula sp. JC737]